MIRITENGAVIAFLLISEGLESFLTTYAWMHLTYAHEVSAHTFLSMCFLMAWTFLTWLLVTVMTVSELKYYLKSQKEGSKYSTPS